MSRKRCCHYRICHQRNSLGWWVSASTAKRCASLWVVGPSVRGQMLCCSVLLTTLQLATAQGHQSLQAAGPVSATAASPLLGPWPPLPRYPLKQVQQRLLQLPASNKPWQQ
jgi:hypothetical protein